MAKLVELVFGYATPRQIRQLSQSIRDNVPSPKWQDEKPRIYCLFVLEGQTPSEPCLIAPRTAQETEVVKNELEKIKEKYITHYPHISERNSCFVDKLANLEFKQGLTFSASKNRFIQLVNENAIKGFTDKTSNGPKNNSNRRKMKPFCENEPDSTLRELDRSIRKLNPDPLGVKHG